MKHLNLTLFVLLFSMLCISCSDEKYKFYVVENPEVLFIDGDQSNYSKGDLLWLNIKIPETQTDQLTDSEIEIFKLTGAKETFIGLSIFNKQSSEIKAVTLNPDIIQIESGSIVIQDNSEILGRAIYQNGVYEMRIGIPLLNSGTFFLANSGKAIGNQGLAFNTDGKNEIQFNTRIRSSNEEGRFEFIVKD